MWHRCAVTRRIEKTPPPGSSDRFCRIAQSRRTISPREVRAAPGPSDPPRVRVTSRMSRKPVPSWRSSRFSKHPWRRVWPCPSRVREYGDSRMGSPVQQSRSTMSAPRSMRRRSGSVQAARSSDSVLTLRAWPGDECRPRRSRGPTVPAVAAATGSVATDIPARGTSARNATAATGTPERKSGSLRHLEGRSGHGRTTRARDLGVSRRQPSWARRRRQVRRLGRVAGQLDGAVVGGAGVGVAT